MRVEQAGDVAAWLAGTLVAPRDTDCLCCGIMALSVFFHDSCSW